MKFSTIAGTFLLLAIPTSIASSVKVAIVPSLRDPRAIPCRDPGKIEWTPSEALAGKVTAPALEAEPGKAEQTLSLTAKTPGEATGSHTFKVRASTKRDGKYLVLSEAEFDIEFSPRWA